VKQLVESVSTSIKEYFLQLIVMFVPTAATAVFTTAVMTESKPKHPPSAGGAGHMSVFGKGIKVC